MMHPALRRSVETVLWLTWLLPLLRLVILMVAATFLRTDIVPAFNGPLDTLVPWIHGGPKGQYLLLFVYPFYFIATLSAYILWHIRSKLPLGMAKRFALGFITTFNIFNTVMYIMRSTHV